MPRHRSYTDEEMFAAYYFSSLNDEAPENSRKSMSELTNEVFGGKVSAMTASNVVASMRSHLEANDEKAAAYRTWKEGRRERKSLYVTSPDGKYSSEFPTVQGFISRKQGTKFRALRSTLETGDKMYRFTNYKNPSNWTGEDQNAFIESETESRQSRMGLIIDLRRLAPHLKDDPVAKRPGELKEKHIKRYFLFDAEINNTLDHMSEMGMETAANLCKIHLVLGCREGSVVHKGEERDRGGLLGLKWNDVVWSNPQRQGQTTIDVYETKTKGGILWRDCPVQLFGWDIQKWLREIKGKQTNVNVRNKTYMLDSSGERIFNFSYKALCDVWDAFEQIARKLYPDARFDAVTPHTSRHLHTNLLKERNIDDLDIIGDGKAGLGYYGVGWETFDTYKDYYVTMNFGTPTAKAKLQAANERNPALARNLVAESKHESVVNQAKGVKA